MPISKHSVCTSFISTGPVLRAESSASHVECAMVGCVRDQCMSRHPCSQIAPPLVLLRSMVDAHDAST
eukprot:5104743-Heterocapsa_arctica.AAC.1